MPRGPRDAIPPRRHYLVPSPSHSSRGGATKKSLTILVTAGAAVACGLAIGVPVPVGAGGGGARRPASPTTVPPALTPAQAGAPLPAAQVDCGQTFLSPPDRATLTGHFGVIFACFQLSGSDQWTIVFAGQLGTSNRPAPAGTYSVALENCRQSASCSNPDVTHSPTSFELYRPPLAAELANPTDFQRVLGENVLMLTDGSCGLVLFDTRTTEWYEVTTDNVHRTAASEAMALVDNRPTGATPFPAQPSALPFRSALSRASAAPALGVSRMCPG